MVLLPFLFVAKPRHGSGHAYVLRLDKDQNNFSKIPENSNAMGILVLSKLIRFYIYSNLHISIAATIFVWSAFSIADFDVNIYYLVFIFSGSFLIYNVHRIIGLTKITKEFRSERHLIFDSDGKIMFALLLIAFIIGSISFVELNSTYRTYLTIPILISTLYIIPLFWKQRLRDINFIKILLISFVWSFFYYIPLRFSSNVGAGIIFFEKFLFIFALTIPFDNRDRHVDQLQGLRTFANIFSEKQSIYLPTLLLIISSVLASVSFYSGQYSGTELGSILISYLLTLVLIINSLDKEEFFFLAYLDGMILLHGLILLLVLN